MSIAWVWVCIVWVSCTTCIIIHSGLWSRKGQVPWVAESIVSIVSYVFSFNNVGCAQA